MDSSDYKSSETNALSKFGFNKIKSSSNRIAMKRNFYFHDESFEKENNAAKWSISIISTETEEGHFLNFKLTGTCSIEVDQSDSEIKISSARNFFVWMKRPIQDFYKIQSTVEITNDQVIIELLNSLEADHFTIEKTKNKVEFSLNINCENKSLSVEHFITLVENILEK